MRDHVIPGHLLDAKLQSVVGPLPLSQEAHVDTLPHAFDGGFTIRGGVYVMRGESRVRSVRTATREVSELTVEALYPHLRERFLDVVLQQVEFLGYGLRAFPAKPSGYRLLRRRSAPRHALGW